MMIRKLTTGGLAIAVLIGLSGRAPVYSAGAKNRNVDRTGQYSGSLDARQHGYEHGYRDGADRGRQDRERGRDYNFRDNDYQIGARDYEGAFGDRGQYMLGYREGYKAGYDDGYDDRPGQYGLLYGRSSEDNQVPPRDDAYAAR